MKSIKVKIVLFVTAVLLAITAMGSLITAYATGKKQIDSQGSMIFSPEITIDGTGGVCELTFSIDAKVEFASFELGVQFPEFVKVMDVRVSNELSKLSDNFEYATENGETLVKTSFVSSENVMGSVDLFTVTLQILYSGYGSPYFVGETLFANNRYEYFNGVGCALGAINAGGGIPMPTVNKGDANLDGSVDLNDLVTMQRHIVSANEQLYGTAYNNADIDNDGIVNTMDCQYVKMYLVGELGSLNGIGGGSQYPGGEEGTKTLQVNVKFVLLASDGEITYLNQYTTDVPVGSIAWDVVGSQVYVYDYQFDTLALDKYGKEPIDGGYVVTNGMELFVIYQGEKTSTEICTVEVVICDQQGNTIHTEYVEVFEGAQIWEVTSRTDVYMYGVQGVYHDAERINPVNDNDTIAGDTTLYVVSPDYKYVPKVKATVYVVTEDGEILTSTTDENVRENQTVWSIVASYCGYPEYRFVKMAYDAEGKNLVPGNAIVSDGLEVYAIMEKGETQWYPLRVEYMIVSGNNIMPMGSHSSDRTMGNMPLLSQGAGEIRGYQAEGVYWDSQLTMPVGENDVLNKDTTIYVKLIAPEMSGTYNLYSMTMTEEGPMPGTEVIGKVTISNGIITIHRAQDEVSGEYKDEISGEYTDLGGMMHFCAHDLHVAMVLIQGDMAFLYYEFDGSTSEEKEELKVIAGHYEFEIEGELVTLDLLSTGVFKMSNHGVSFVGPYDFNAFTNEITLYAMGEPQVLIYDPATKTVTPVEEDDGNVTNPDDPSQDDFTGRTFYAPTEDASGNIVQHELGCDEFGWFLVLEPSYAYKLGLESYSFNADEAYLIGDVINFYIEEYVVFNITLYPENDSFKITKFVDLSNKEYNETCAKYAGKYQLYFEGEISTVQLYDNGVAVVHNNGAKDIAEFYEVEEKVLSIGDRSRVFVDFDNNTLTVDETADEGGSSSSGKLPTTGTVTLN